MVDVYTDWCGWCKKMDKETFNHPVIAKYINENYIRELHESYEHWAERIPVISPLHVVNTEQLDLKNDRKAQNELVETIQSLSRLKDQKGGT